MSINNSDFPGPEDIIPPNAPPELVTLAININEIIQPLQKIRGTAYTQQLIIFLTLFQQASELENIACTSTCLVRQYLPEFAEMATVKHDMTHILADAIQNSLVRLVDFQENLPGFDGFNKDLELLMNRVKHDWHDKIGRQ